jgi:uncharacterized protein YjiS (DUF1127 family)
MCREAGGRGNVSPAQTGYENQNVKGMSQYQLQKLCRAVNSDPAARERFQTEQDAFVGEFDLTAAERKALADMDIDALYDLGVHPLLLRPFTIIAGVSQEDYLAALNPGG